MRLVNRLANTNIKDIYKLSPMQEGMYFNFLYNRSSTAYFSQISYRFTGHLDTNKVKNSLNELVRRYDILRTVFNHEKKDIPLQIVLKKQEADFEYENIHTLSTKEEKETYIEEVKVKDRERNFDLNTDVLIRVKLLQLDEEEYEFIWSTHHILMDGWCLGIIISEFLEIYKSIKGNKECNSSQVIQYRKYIDWLDKQNFAKGIAYWKEYLQGFTKKSSVPVVKKKLKDKIEYTNEEDYLYLDVKKTTALNKLAHKNKVTINVVLQTIWAVLLAKYNRENDVVFGIVVSGRPPEIEGIEKMVGLFVNTIPLRIKFDKQTKFSKLIKRVYEDSACTQKYHYISLAQIQSQSEIKLDLIDQIFVFQNFPALSQIVDESKNEDVEFSLSRVEHFTHTSYDFNILFTPEDKLWIILQYNKNLYDRTSIKTLLEFLERVIDQVIENEEIDIEEIDLLSEGVRDTILYEFNKTEADYPKERSIISLFEEQVQKTPDALAIISNEETISFAELNKRANQLAHFLWNRGVGRDKIVGLMVHRSIEMFIGIVGTLKAGGAYLPLDPNYPEDRVRFIIVDCQAYCLLTQGHILEGLDFEGGVIDLDLEPFSTEDSNLDSTPTPMDLAYVIYTSGSTGNPKGVMITHHSVINRINWMQKQYPLTESDIILHKTPITFDVSVWEIFWWGFVGAKVCVLPSGMEKDPEQIVNYISIHRVTTIHFVPTMLNVFLEYVGTEHAIAKLSTLRRVFASGEVLKPEYVAKFNHMLYKQNATYLTNLYGPTETTVDVTYYDCSPHDGELIPIGKPIDNTKIYIMNDNKLAPIGIPGELCIAGVGLARDYINHPEESRERFVSNTVIPGERIYRTGDLARWLPDGNIQYIGRLDNQVKVCGFRIELEEVEAHLVKYDGVTNALTAVAERNGAGILCALVLGDGEIEISYLKNFLRQRLPKYMIPSIIIQVEEFPISQNGKADRSFVKTIDIFNLNQKDAYIMPRSTKEKIIYNLWVEILNSKNIRVNDNFFDIGGTSIDAIRLASKLKKAFKKDVAVIDMFTYTTIRLQSEFLDEENTDCQNKIAVTEIFKPAQNKMKQNLMKMRRK